MLAIITKVTSDYWYEIKEVNTIEELFKIYHSTIVGKNEYHNWTEEDFLMYWDGIKKEDIPLMQRAECHITIYDDYVE